MGCGLCGLEFPPAPKEGHQESYLLPKIRAEREKGVTGLEICQQTLKTEPESSL